MSKLEKLMKCLRAIEEGNNTPLKMATHSDMSYNTVINSTKLLLKNKIIGKHKRGWYYKNPEISERDVAALLGIKLPGIDYPKQCQHCEEMRSRILCPVSTYKKYIDDKGALWKGATCPACATNNGKDDFVFDAPTQRKCRECSRFLPASRYFKCYDCEPALSDIDDDFIYDSSEAVWEFNDNIVDVYRKKEDESHSDETLE